MHKEREMADFMQSCAEYARKTILREEMQTVVRYFRAQVVAPAANGKITVARRGDPTQIQLPYVGSAEQLAEGQQCVVLVFGNMSNAIVLGDGTLSNL